MKINEDKLEEVGDIVEVDPKVLKQQKRRKLHGILIHYFIQIFVFLFSSLMGYLFVLWEHSDRSGYPYGVFPRYMTLGTFSLFTLHGGNVTQSYFHKKRYKLHYIEVFPAVFVNLIISFISFFMIYSAFYQEPFYGFGVVPAYGVYEKGNSKRIRKIMIR